MESVPKARRVASQRSVKTLRPKGNACALVAATFMVLVVSACSNLSSTRAPPPGGMAVGGSVRAGVGPHRLAAPARGPGTGNDACADPGPVADHGGPVETEPKVYVDFWGWRSDPAGERPYLLSFLSSVGGSPWLSTVKQYCASDDPRLAGYWNSSGVPPLQPTNADIQAQGRVAVRHFAIGGLPASGAPNIQIVVALPPDASLPDADDEDCAYHERLENSDGAVSDHAFVLTALPYVPGSNFGPECGAFSVNARGRGALDGVSITEGHELVESITDPEGNAWHDDGHPTEEIADRCATQIDYDIRSRKPDICRPAALEQ